MSSDGQCLVVSGAGFCSCHQPPVTALPFRGRKLAVTDGLIVSRIRILSYGTEVGVLAENALRVRNWEQQKSGTSQLIYLGRVQSP